MAPGDGPAEGEAAIEVEVAYSPAAGQVVQVTLSLPAGATVAQALRASGLLSRHPELQAESLQCGVWGILCAGDVRLRARDRVEVYRPLKVDPKEARRLRYRGDRSAAKPR